MTIAMFEPRVSDREFAEHNTEIMNGWLANWCRSAWRRPAPCSHCGHNRLQAAQVRGRARPAKNRFTGILSELGLNVPKELGQ